MSSNREIAQRLRASDAIPELEDALAKCNQEIDTLQARYSVVTQSLLDAERHLDAERTSHAETRRQLEDREERIVDLRQRITDLLGGCAKRCLPGRHVAECPQAYLLRDESQRRQLERMREVLSRCLNALEAYEPNGKLRDDVEAALEESR